MTHVYEPTPEEDYEPFPDLTDADYQAHLAEEDAAVPAWYETMSKEELLRELRDNLEEEPEEWQQFYRAPVRNNSTELTPKEQALADTFIAGVVGIDDIKEDPEDIVIPGFVVARDQ